MRKPEFGLTALLIDLKDDFSACPLVLVFHKVQLAARDMPNNHFAPGRSGNRGKRNVALCQMHQSSVGVVHVGRATGAALLPLRTKHEVMED